MRQSLHGKRRKKMWGRLKDIVQNSRALSIDKALQFALNKPEIKDYIIYLNTDEQLFSRGVDANDIDLEEIGGSYSSFTIFLKQQEGLPYDRITLYDTGAFYSSFKVKVGKKFFEINADTRKDDDDLTDRWGEDILGLTDESVWSLIQEIISDVRESIKTQILKDRPTGA